MIIRPILRARSFLGLSRTIYSFIETQVNKENINSGYVILLLVLFKISKQVNCCPMILKTHVYGHFQGRIGRWGPGPRGH